MGRSYDASGVAQMVDAAVYPAAMAFCVIFAPLQEARPAMQMHCDLVHDWRLGESGFR
jgi:hypothetical protein